MSHGEKTQSPSKSQTGRFDNIDSAVIISSVSKAVGYKTVDLLRLYFSSLNSFVMRIAGFFNIFVNFFVRNLLRKLSKI